LNAPTNAPPIDPAPTTSYNPGNATPVGVAAPVSAGPTVSLNPYVNTSPADVVTPTSGTSPIESSPPITASPTGIAPVQSQNNQRERFVAAMGGVQKILDEGRLSAALLSLSEWLDEPSIPPEEYAQLLDLLDRLAATVIYSREHLIEPAYRVQPGENLYQIADRYQTPWQLLAKINGVADPHQVRPGDTLKVMRGPFDAVVNLRTNEVTLMLRGHYAGRFKCAVGQDATTPVGEYAVREKKANPTYYGPTGIVDADDPGNPLGERQLDLGSKISLHSTNDPNGIAPNETRGSIRLGRADAEDLYDILSVGSRVAIRR